MRRMPVLIALATAWTALIVAPTSGVPIGAPAAVLAVADPTWNAGTTLPIPATTVGATATLHPAAGGGGDGYITVMEQTNPLQPARVVYVDWTGSVSALFGEGGSMTVQSADLTQRIDEVGPDGVADAANRFFVAGRRGGSWYVSAWTTGGQQDASFGSSGWVNATPAGHTASSAWPPILRIDPNGRLVVIGWVTPLGGGSGRLAFVRLQPNGSLDTAFGPDGTGVVLQAVGRDVDNTTGSVAGAFGTWPLYVTGTNAEGLGFVSAMDIDGRPVMTFGSQGVVVDSFFGCGRGITGANGNELYVLCQYPTFAGQVVGVRRLSITGAVDRSYGDGGWALVPATTSANSRGWTIGNMNGRIVVGGATTDGGLFASPDWDAALWSFNLDGQIDLGMGERGVERIRGAGNVDVVDLASVVGPSGFSVAALLTGGPSSPSVGLARRTLSSNPATTSAQPLATPRRVLDTRSGIGAPAGRLVGGSVLQLAVAGSSGVPADAVAVALNVTSTESDLPGYATVWPCGAAQPTASNLNWNAGATVPNLVYARIGVGGTVCLFSNVSTHVIADVTAYFASDTDYEPLATPERIIDTRSPTDKNTGKIGGAKVAQLPLLPVSVSANRTRAVVVNVTVTEPEGSGYVTVYPCDEPRPLASSLNYTSGQTVANLVSVRSDGGVCFFSSSMTHLVVDAQGLVPLGGGHRPLVPTRLLDTRDGEFARRTESGQVVPLQIAGRAGIPTTARAVTLNVTATEPERAGFVTVYPCGVAVPVASNLNVAAGETRANAATVGIGDSGRVCLFTNIETHLVVDVTEWFPSRSVVRLTPV